MDKKQIQKIEQEIEKKDSETDLQYLGNSLVFLGNSLKQSQDAFKTISEQIKALQSDMEIIQSSELKNACVQIHNNLAMQKKNFSFKIKETRVDLKHVNSIFKKMKEYEKL